MPGLRDKIRRLRRRRIVAIGLDAPKVWIAEATGAGGKIRLGTLHTADAPQGMDFGDPAAVGGFIRDQLAAAGLRGPIAMNVPRSQAVLKSFALPAGTRADELPNMVRYQLEKDLPFRPEEAVIDFTPEPSPAATDRQEAPQIKILAAAVRLPVIDYYRRIAEAAGARLAHLGFRPCSDHRGVRAFGKLKSDECVGLLHIAADETEISFLVGQSLAFSRSAGLKIPRQQGPAGGGSASVRDVLVEATRTLQSFVALAQSTAVSGFLVAGGTGIEAAVAEELGRRTGIQAAVLQVQSPRGADSGGGGSGFISAVGLAIGCCDRAPLPIDLLRPKRPRAKRDATKLRKASLATAAAVALVVAILSGRSHLGAKRSRLAALEGELGQLKAQNKQLTALTKRVGAIEAWVSSGRTWLDHMALLSGMLPNCTSAYVSSVKTDSGNVITFAIRAKDSEVISDLCRDLAEAGYKPSAGQLTTANDPYGLDYSYSTDIKLIVPGGMKVDLSAVKPRPRPRDDDSANVLQARAGSASRRRRR